MAARLKSSSLLVDRSETTPWLRGNQKNMDPEHLKKHARFHKELDSETQKKNNFVVNLGEETSLDLGAMTVHHQ